MGLETARAGRFGYASRHLLVSVDASRTVPAAYESLRRRSASVQIRTVLQHAWAEFEHDIRYKGTVPEEHAHDLDRRFTLAAGLIELADREFSAIRDRLQMALPASHARPGRAGPADQRAGPRQVPRRRSTPTPAGRAPTTTPGSPGLLLELGITSVDALAEVIAPVDGADLIERMGYKYPPGAVRRLDDALLATFGTRYLDLEGNAHRRASLEARLGRLAAELTGAEPEKVRPACRFRRGEFVRMMWRGSPPRSLTAAHLIEKEPAMADTYVYLIHEGDWDSDAYLGGEPRRRQPRGQGPRRARRRRRHGRVVPRAQGLPAGRRRPRRPRRRGRRPAELAPRRHRDPRRQGTATSRTPSTPTARSPTRPR